MAIGELEATLKQPTATKSGQLLHMWAQPRIRFAREYAEAVKTLKEAVAIEPEPVFKFPGVRSLLPFELRLDKPILGGEEKFEETKKFALENFGTVVKGIYKEAKAREPYEEAVFRAMAKPGTSLEDIQTVAEEGMKESMREIYKETFLQEYKTTIKEKETKERYEKETIIKFPEVKWPDLGLGGLTDLLGGIGKNALLYGGLILGGLYLWKKK